jgi:hypothetical protein
VPAELPPGQWGGDHISMVVTATSVRLDFDCAHGAVDDTPLLDPAGRFNLSGVYVREHGGPVHDGEAEDSHAAVYVGQLEGSRATLSIQLTDESTWIGPFEARLGQQATVFKCLRPAAGASPLAASESTEHRS